MEKKLQIFISSTYKDMLDERQAAVETILQAGHIPAGMELFSSNNKKQFEVIKRWIRESDIIILLLGGRYGAIDKDENKSYTHMEYEYATQIGKKPYAFVLNDFGLKKKINDGIYDPIDAEFQGDQYKAFKKIVMDNLCDFFTDHVSLRSALFKAIRTFEGEVPSHVGWVRAASAMPVDQQMYYIREESMGIEYIDKNNCIFTHDFSFISTVNQLQYISENYAWSYGGTIRAESLYKDDILADQFLQYDRNFVCALRFPHRITVGQEKRVGYRLIIENCNNIGHLFLSKNFVYKRTGIIKLWAKIPDTFAFESASFKYLSVTKPEEIETKLNVGDEKILEHKFNETTSRGDTIQLDWKLKP